MVPRCAPPHITLLSPLSTSHALLSHQATPTWPSGPHPTGPPKPRAALFPSPPPPLCGAPPARAPPGRVPQKKGPAKSRRSGEIDRVWRNREGLAKSRGSGEPDTMPSESPFAGLADTIMDGTRRDVVAYAGSGHGTSFKTVMRYRLPVSPLTTGQRRSCTATNTTHH